MSSHPVPTPPNSQEPARLLELISVEARKRGGVEGEAALEHGSLLARFLTILRQENQRMNLVSSRAAEPEELVRRHLFDSLFGLRFLPSAIPKRAFRLLDLGSGGGFPALPLLIVRPDIEGTLVDSTEKKCAFLRHAVGDLGLTAQVLNARFPSSFPMKTIAPFDLLTTRAVNAAGVLVRDARPIFLGKALLWTTEGLWREAARESRLPRAAFHLATGAESRGIAVLECST
ncbi:MAG: 16S rRNA (guanine(527)-N(7))-methyltransferase RsmG [Thermoanaerobaculia bacterium]